MNEVAIEITSGRHNALIDPRLHIWGFEIPVYLFLGGAVAGLLVIGAFFELKRGERSRSNAMALSPFLGLILISLGMGALFLDLEHKVEVFRFYLAFEPTSPMSWGSWILLLVYPLGLALGLLSLTECQRAWVREKLPAGRLWDRLAAALERVRGPLLWTAAIVGAGLGVYTGLLLGTMVARPQWHSAVLGPLFLCSGVSTGAALMLLFRLEEHEHRALLRLDMWAIVLELALIALLLIDYATGGLAQRHALYHVAGGPWTSAFWSLVVIGGLLVPLSMELIGLRRKLPFAVMAPVLILLGGLALRFVLLSAGQASNFREFF
jgi:protein NrfD